MDPLTGIALLSATSAALGSGKGSPTLSALKTALDMPAKVVSTLVDAVPSTALALTGAIGTLINTYA